MRVSEKGSYDLFIDCKTIVQTFFAFVISIFKVEFQKRVVCSQAEL